MNEKRNNSLNILKAICCILIVFIHCKFPRTLGILIQNYGRIGVPIFFMISGYFVKNNDNKKIKCKILKNIKLLIISCTFYFMLNCFKYFINIESFKSYMLNFINDRTIINFILFNGNPFWEHLWFIHALIYCYSYQLIMNKINICNKKRELFISLMLLFIYQVINYLVIDETFKYIYFIRNFIFVGIPFFNIGKYITSKKKKRSLYVIVSVISFIVLNIEILVYKNELYISSIALAICLFKYVIDYRDHFNKYLDYMGDRLSMYIYILHPAIKWIYLYLFQYLDIHTGIFLWIEPLIMLVTAIIISIIIDKLKNKREILKLKIRTSI